MCIGVKIIEDSVWPHACSKESRLTTFSVIFPRYILPQVLTHRVFSRNAQSSRAIPTKKLIEQVVKNPVMPHTFKTNRKGMQGGEVLDKESYSRAEQIWLEARDTAVNHARTLYATCNVHKEILNRILEPYTTTCMVITGTEWDNFFKLRCSDDAQPEIQELAQQMRATLESSKPRSSSTHLPFVSDEEKNSYTFDFLNKVSAARCARVSYKNHDGTKCDIQKDTYLAERLLRDGHMSPFEHQAKACLFGQEFYANFRGWKSHRYELENGKK